jgi:holo-[acyl-carrier protein] synthase
VVLEFAVAIVGLGIDVVDIERAEAMFAVRRRRVLTRLLTSPELEYVEKMRHPARHLAVRLAAKEAVYKALQSLPDSRGVGWREIEVLRGPHGKPSIALHGRAAEVVALRPGARVHVSLTHSDRSAVAVAVLED